MLLIKEKLVKEIKPYKWFAWRPVWAWESEDLGLLHLVWLQTVIRDNGYTKKYRYYLK